MTATWESGTWPNALRSLRNPPTMAINVSLRKNLPYNPATDFVPLAGIAKVPFILMVNPGLPASSVPELVRYAKEKPGLSFGSSGPGSPHHLFMELFRTTTGIELTHVPYRGSLPAVTDVAAGHIGLMFCDYGPAEPMLKAGKVKALGISTRTRLSTAPEIAPLAEAGVPGFDAAAWQMLARRRGAAQRRAPGDPGAARGEGGDRALRLRADGGCPDRDAAGLHAVGDRAVEQGGA